MHFEVWRCTCFCDFLPFFLPRSASVPNFPISMHSLKIADFLREEKSCCWYSTDWLPSSSVFPEPGNIIRLMARCSFMERMALISALLASFFLCACSQFSCPLSGSMELAWSIPQGEDWINMTATLSSPTNWLSFGVIKPLLYMVPASEPHSVFLYSAGGYLGRYAMTAMDSSGFVGEAHASASVAAHSTGQQTFLHVNYSNSPAGYGVPLNIQGGNFLIWAHGGDWPSIHTNKGFVHVNWLKGTCVAVAQSEGVSPFAIFVTLLIILVFARTPFLHNTWPILWLRNTRLYYFTDYSVAGGLIILIHLIIVFSVLGSQIAVAGSTDQARVSATGIIAVMNLWMTLLPSSKSIVMFWLTSVPFERSMKYHQLLSSFTIFLAFIHLLYNATTNAGIFFSAEPTQAEVVPVMSI